MGFVARAEAEVTASGVRGHGSEIVLTEHLNKRWDDEPLSYRFEAAEGACHVNSLRLNGPSGAMPVQLTDVELWPGTQSVRSATVWFIADLAPLAEKVYTLSWGPEAGDAAGANDDLEVAVSDEDVRMTTSRFGARLRLGGEQYEQPKPASDVPGPIAELRLADGTWFGGSDLSGPTRVAAWSAEVTAAGPVFGEVRYRYEYENGNTVAFTARLFARGDHVQIDTDVAKHSPDDAIRINVSRGLPALSLQLQKLFHEQRQGVFPADLALGDWVTVSMETLMAHPPRSPSLPDGLVQKVASWGSWWDETYMPVVRLCIGEGERELHVARRDPASWVKPRETPWQAGESAEEEWEGWMSKNLPIIHGSDGQTRIVHTFDAGAVGGVRKFDIADSRPTEAVGWRPERHDMRGKRTGAQVIQYHPPLNVVKDYVLDWPAQTEHPRLFMDAEQIAASRPEQVDKGRIDWLRALAGKTGGDVPHMRDEATLAIWLLTGDDEIARELHLADRLKRYLGSLGDFDKMRQTVTMAALYDAVIDSDLVTSEERRVLRAQMAYLAYQINDPTTWDAQRGWKAFNPTMTYSYRALAPLAMAGVLNDHPRAEAWAEGALPLLEDALDQIHPSGQWPESSSYGSLGISRLLTKAILATRGGFGDYISDPRLERAVLYYQAIRTPPDPRFDGMREFIRYGRLSLSTHALEGLWASALRDLRPEASRHMQWFWRQRLETAPGYGRLWSDLSPGLGGFEYLYINDTLPAEQPDWHTQRFPELGAIFRHGFAEPQEHFHALLSGDHWTSIYASQTGGLVAMFAYGKPVSTSFFYGYGEQSEYFINRVSLARDPADYVRGETPIEFLGVPRGSIKFEDGPETDFASQSEGESRLSGFAAMPRQDYAAVDVAMIRPYAPRRPIPDDLPWPQMIASDGEPPLWWRRQTLFVKDDDPAATGNYLIMRDTVKGDQPTMWTFWTSSEKIGTPEEADDRETFLADAPGSEIVEPRELYGDRFTAVSQWGVDLEYYIAEPTDTPRHTLRWGRNYNVAPIYNKELYQDLLHLQREGDGSYYVALFPRKTDDGTAPPRFETVGDGRIIKVEGDFGTDWTFLAEEHADATADGVTFTGTAASVQHRQGETVISLGAEGRVSTSAASLEADGGATLRWRGGPAEADEPVFRVELPREHDGVRLRLELPGDGYALRDEAGALEHADGTWILTVPAEVEALVLEPGS